MTTLPPLLSITVPHLGGIEAAYRCLPATPDPSKRTLVMVNSFMTNSGLYRPQFESVALQKEFNLVAIDALGHGGTRTASDTFTYWDSAIMNVQVLEKLGVTERVVGLGTSQGGWIVTRMALLNPSLITGLTICGSSMDYESAESRNAGCWDAAAFFLPTLALYTTADAGFVFPQASIEATFAVGFGQDFDLTPEVHEFWTSTIGATYSGADGQRRARMVTINLLERDGLLLRIPDVKCPVLWLHVR
ncbi:hypothetical protein RQP46_006873 [Phenoliferia psychrophenolica]